MPHLLIFHWLIEDDMKRREDEGEANQGQLFSTNIGKELCDFKFAKIC